MNGKNYTVRILTRKDLRFYINEDRKSNRISKNSFIYYLKLLAGNENAAAYRYIKCLRHLEYHLNNSDNSMYHKILYYYYKFSLSRLGMKYSISIRPNSCGYGLRILHLSGGGGCRIGAIRTGNYCRFNAGVLIGTNGSEDSRPTLGDYVGFGPGAKAYGKITIGNTVFVASNAVVVKDVPDNCIVGGVPAKILKYNK